MSRILPEILAAAIARVRAMDLRQKENLTDELYRAQPNVLASFLVQQRFGVSLAKMEFLIELMLICFQAMKDSDCAWTLITEDEQERQLARLVAAIRFGEDLSQDLRAQALRAYVDAHPEKVLFAYVQAEVNGWLQRVEPEDSDKYVALAAMNFVNCIAFAPTSSSENAERN